MKFLSLFIVFLSLCGCNTNRSDPLPAFRQVQNEIEHRTGHYPIWIENKSQRDWFKCYIEESLQEEELTEEKAVEIAPLNNRGLQATYQKLGIAQAQLVQAGLLTNPIFSANPRYHKSDSYMVELGIVHNLLDLLLKPLQKKLACSELQKTKKQVEGMILDVIAKTKIAFHTYNANKALLKISKNILETSEFLNTVSLRMQKAGNITSLSQLTFQSQKGVVEMEVASVELAALIAKEKLSVMLGLTQISDTLPNEFEQDIEDFPDFSLDECEEAAISNSLDLQIARLNIRSMALKSGIKLTETVFQELTLGVHSEREDNGEWFVGPQISVAIPLFDIGQAQRAANRAEIRMQLEDYMQKILEVRSAARTIAGRHLNWAYRMNYFQQILIPLTEQTTQETLLQYNAMQIGVLDLLKAKQAEFEIKKQFIQVMLEYRIAKAELEQMMSGKKPDNFNEIF